MLTKLVVFTVDVDVGKGKRKEREQEVSLAFALCRASHEESANSGRDNRH